MNLFIDTNIFLEFYRLSGEDIEELKKLTKLLEDGTISLFYTEQLEKEIIRNRDSIVNDSISLFKKVNFKISTPAFCKLFAEFEEIQSLLKSANIKHSELIAKVTDKIETNELQADTLIKDLLNRAEQIEFTDPIYYSALKRFRVGNPPGKKKVTIGDEINWESLLAGIPNNEELYFISGDGDFSSPINDKILHSFLSNEWKKEKSSEIHFFRSLNEFLKTKFPNIRIATDIEVNKLIERLTICGSFSNTHSIIANLNQYESFSKSQAEQLILAAETNSQVGWILGDDDILHFYQHLLERHKDLIDQALREILEKMLDEVTSE